MGPRSSKSSKEKNNHYEEPKKQKEEIVTRHSFEFLGIIGRGGFGKVWKVYSRKYKCQYAMKEMSKAKIIDKRSERSVKAERNLLAKMNHPFIINMHFAFQDKENLYIAMDLLTGGDLRYHICRNKYFSEAQTKFFIACIILSLEYCHRNNIIHRDLKPENLVLDRKGYVKLTDFGIAKIYQKENYRETSGTPGYMAPEVMCGQNHTIAVDYFALGVIGYELMKGVRPYLGRNRKEIKEKLLARQVQVKLNEIPQGWSVESADFINRLLQRKPANRLGLQGATEVKEHPWFKYYPWKDLYLGKLQAPFVPRGNENFDFKYCNAPDKMGINTEERYQIIVNSTRYIEVFQDFYYFNRNSKSSSEENERLRNFVAVNPHLCYLEEKENDEVSVAKNKSLILSNRLGIEDDKFYSLRKGNSASSSTILLKGYRNDSCLSNNSNISNKMTGSGTNYSNGFHFFK